MSPRTPLCDALGIEPPIVQAPRARPSEGEVVATGPDGSPIVRYAVDNPELGTTDEVEALALYAGQSFGLVHEVLPAGEIVRAIAEEAERTLRGIAG